MSNPKYKLDVIWSDVDAGYYYTMSASNHYDRKHSCYSCYDDWAFGRRKCYNNQKNWTSVPNASGDRSWAKKIAKHHNILLPEEPAV